MEHAVTIERKGSMGLRIFLFLASAAGFITASVYLAFHGDRYIGAVIIFFLVSLVLLFLAFRSIRKQFIVFYKGNVMYTSYGWMRKRVQWIRPGSDFAVSAESRSYNRKTGSITSTVNYFFVLMLREQKGPFYFVLEPYFKQLADCEKRAAYYKNLLKTEPVKMPTAAGSRPT